MRLLRVGTLTACVLSVHAFRDTSPFLLFSSSPLPPALQNTSADQLQPADNVLKVTKDFLATCPSDFYVIVTQPAISLSDLASPSSIPFLREALSRQDAQTVLSVSEVVGLKDFNPTALPIAQELAKVVETRCGNVEVFEERDMNSPSGQLHFDDQGPNWKKGNKMVVLVNFEPLSATDLERQKELATNDALIDRYFLKDIPQNFKYTVVLLTTPSSDIIDDIQAYAYEAAFQEPIHMDLKRNSFPPRANSNTTIDPRPLFEKYQFLTPGLFMGLLVTLLLLIILSVGIKALGSLQVSYGAFDKDMGPTAQKRQQ